MTHDNEETERRSPDASGRSAGHARTGCRHGGCAEADPSAACARNERCRSAPAHEEFAARTANAFPDDDLVVLGVTAGSRLVLMPRCLRGTPAARLALRFVEVGPQSAPWPPQRCGHRDVRRFRVVP